MDDIEKLRVALLRIQDLAHDLYYWQNLGNAREALHLIDSETRLALPEIWDRPWSNGRNPEEGSHTVDPANTGDYILDIRSPDSYV